LVFDNLLSFCQDDEYDRALTRIANFTITLSRHELGRVVGGSDLHAFIREKYLRSMAYRLPRDALGPYIQQLAKSVASRPSGARVPVRGGTDSEQPVPLPNGPESPSDSIPGSALESTASLSSLSSLSLAGSSQVSMAGRQGAHFLGPSVLRDLQQAPTKSRGPALGRRKRTEAKSLADVRAASQLFGRDRNAAFSPEALSRAVHADILAHNWATSEVFLALCVFGTVVLARMTRPRVHGIPPPLPAPRGQKQPESGQTASLPTSFTSTDGTEVSTLQFFPDALGYCVDRKYVLVMHSEGELAVYRYDLANYTAFVSIQADLSVLRGVPAVGGPKARPQLLQQSSSRFPVQVRISPSGNLVAVAGAGLLLFSLEFQSTLSSLAAQELGRSSDARYWMSTSLWPSSAPQDTPSGRYLDNCMHGQSANAAERANKVQRAISSQASSSFYTLQPVAGWTNSDLRKLLQVEFEEITELVLFSDEVACIMCDQTHLLAFPLTGAIFLHNASVLTAAGALGGGLGLDRSPHSSLHNSLHSSLHISVSRMTIDFQVFGFRSYKGDGKYHLAIAGKEQYAVYRLTPAEGFDLVLELSGHYTPLKGEGIQVFRPTDQASRCCGEPLLVISDGASTRRICTDCGQVTEDPDRGFVAFHGDCLYEWN